MNQLAIFFLAVVLMGCSIFGGDDETASQASLAALSVSASSSLTYGAVWVGNSQDETFTLTNTGTAAAKAISVTFPNSSFTYKGGSFPGAGGTCHPSLGAGYTCTIVTTFAPAEAGSLSGNIVFSYRYRAGTETISKEVSASGKISALLSVSVSSSSYGTVSGGAYSDKTLTLSNSGSVSATSMSVTANSPFSSPGGGTCGSSLAGGESCTLIIRYSPSACTSQSDSISIGYENGLTSTSVSQSLSGTGGCASLSISDGTTYDYGFQILNSTTDKTFTVTNTGDAAASSVTGVATTPFSFPGGTFPGGGDCTSSLSTTGTCTFVGRFTASTCGAASDSFSVNYSNGIATTSATRAVTGYTRCPGYADIRFNTSGYTVTTFGSNYYGLANALQTDGKLLIGGTNTTPDFVLQRYLTSGTLDTSFFTSGTRTINGGGGFDAFYALVIQTDGKILAAGEANTLHVYRLDSDGILDTSFFTSGMQTSVSGGGNTLGNSGGATGMALQTDGAIVVSNADNSALWGVARLTPSGNIDTSFYTSGVRAIDLSGTDSGDSPENIRVQTDGKIVALGFNLVGGSDAWFAAVRFLTSGSLDTTFATDGSASYNLSPSSSKGHQGVIDTTGRIVVASAIGIVGGEDFQIVRLETNGALDTAFSTDGVAPSLGTPAGSTIARGIHLMTDGSIFGGGDNQNGALMVVKYLSNGRLDTSFNTNAIKYTNIAGVTSYSMASGTERFCIAGDFNNQMGSACFFAY